MGFFSVAVVWGFWVGCGAFFLLVGSCAFVVPGFEVGYWHCVAFVSDADGSSWHGWELPWLFLLIIVVIGPLFNKSY